MDQLESINSTLLLKTCDLTGNVGSKNTGNSIFTWNNIDMQSILGNEYDKYDYFELQLTNVCSGILQSSAYVNHDRCKSIRMSGLPWVNCDYNYQNTIQKSMRNNNIIVGHINMFPTSTQLGTLTQYPSNIKCCFGKTKTAEITIQIFSILQQKVDPNSNAMPNPEFVFMFSIRGVKYEKLSSQLALLTRFEASNATGTSHVFKVDMRSVLGTLWDNYDYFNISLVEIYSTYFSSSITGNNVICAVTLQGLPFINSTHNLATNHKNNIATIGYFNLAQTNIGGITQNGILAQNTFSKCVNNVELTVEFRRISDNEYATPNSSTLNAREYLFVITPVIK